jgi:phosphate uptake regulator
MKTNAGSMKRKVVQQGPSTLMVSLPAKWAQKHGIGKGESLEVAEVGNDLLISSGKEPDAKPAMLDTKGMGIGQIRQYLHELYQSGYDEIRVSIADPSSAADIQEYASMVLIGYEVVDQQENSITIRSISRSIEDEFDPILRRAFHVTKQLGLNSLAIIREQQYQRLGEVMVLEDTNDKLTNFCLRVLVKRGYKVPAKTGYMFCLVWLLEKLADEHKYIGEYIGKAKSIAIDSSVLALYDKVNSLYDAFYRLFYEYSLESLAAYSSASASYLALAIQLQSASSGKQDAVISHLHVMLSYLRGAMDQLIGMHV